MVKITICGAFGRMGLRILDLAKSDREVDIIGVIEAKTHPQTGKTIEGLKCRVETDLKKVISQTDVVIDFTNPQATIEHLKITQDAGKSIVIGTTGFKDAEIELIKKSARTIPVVMSPNMSIGVNLLFKLVDETAKVIPYYDVEIIETHHNQKKDAPSGTAKKIARIISKVLNRDLAKVGIYGREGMTGPRKSDEIGVHTVRAGDVVGEHVVLFAGKGERIELTHRAHSRDTFASGAIRAAKWIVNKKSGFYDMQDVLGLK